MLIFTQKTSDINDVKWQRVYFSFDKSKPSSTLALALAQAQALAKPPKLEPPPTVPRACLGLSCKGRPALLSCQQPAELYSAQAKLYSS